MAERIVVFGATGYTGDLTARALVDRGARPVLAARNEARVRALAEELGGLEWAVADVSRPDSVRALVERGDVLVSTVGPFARWGEPAVQAAIGARRALPRLDRRGQLHPRASSSASARGAQAAGCGLLTAFGYDWVPGNLAGALALRDAGEAATRVEIGYFNPGAGAASMSGGTRASAAGVMLSPGFAWRGGRLVDERPARHGRAFELSPGKRARAVSVGRAPSTSRCRACTRPCATSTSTSGWFGPASRAAARDVGRHGPGAEAARRARDGAATASSRRFVKGSTGGPDAAARATSALARRWPRPTTPPGRGWPTCAWRASTATTSRRGFLAWGAADRRRGRPAGHRRAGAGRRLRARRAGGRVRGDRDRSGVVGTCSGERGERTTSSARRAGTSRRSWSPGRVTATTRGPLRECPPRHRRRQLVLVPAQRCADVARTAACRDPPGPPASRTWPRTPRRTRPAPPPSGSTTPSTTATCSPSRWTVARGSTRRWRALTDSGDVEKTSAPSIHRAHTGLTCGGPSARAVQSQ